MFAWIRGHLPTRETISPGKKQTNKNISGYSWFPDFEASKISHFRIYLIMKIEKKIYLELLAHYHSLHLASRNTT